MSRRKPTANPFLFLRVAPCKPQCAMSTPKPSLAGAGVSFGGWEPPEDRTSNAVEGGASQNDEPPTTVDDGHTGETVDKELMVSSTTLQNNPYWHSTTFNNYAFVVLFTQQPLVFARNQVLTSYKS